MTRRRTGPGDAWRRPVGESSVLMRGSGASRAASRTLVLLGIALVSLLGCTAHEASTPEKRYRPEFEELIAKVGDDEPAASILEDYRLDEVEIEQLHDAYVSCVADQGFRGLYFDSITGSTGFSRGIADERFNDARKTMDDCDTSTHSSDVTYLYAQLIQNPEKEDPNQVVIDCMVRRGVLDPSYTVERFDKELEAWIEQPHTMKGEQIIGSPGEAFTYLGDREEGIRVFMECSYDPTSGDTSESG